MLQGMTVVATGACSATSWVVTRQLPAVSNFASTLPISSETRTVRPELNVPVIPKLMPSPFACQASSTAPRATRLSRGMVPVATMANLSPAMVAQAPTSQAPGSQATQLLQVDLLRVSYVTLPCLCCLLQRVNFSA